MYFLDTSTPENIYLAAVLLFVTFMNAGIEFYQTYKSAAILESFLTLIPHQSNVIRDGQRIEVQATQLVLGDLVIFKTGEKAPADIRIVLTSSDLRVDNSSITGESEPQERSLAKGSVNPLEATNLIFNGSLIVSGEGMGIVIRIGASSMLGQIANLTMSSKKRSSQLTKDISLFVKKVSGVAALFALVFSLLGIIIRGYSASVTLSCCIGLLVAFVPQGLPATVTVLLTIAAKKLAKQNVLVKDLHGVETLGAITMLATDKTGTLTQNKMTVVGCWLGNEVFRVTDDQDQSFVAGGKPLLLETPNAGILINACGLCSKARFDDSADQQNLPNAERKIFGDATESGLLRFVGNRCDILGLRQSRPKIYEISFNSATKWHLTIHSFPASEANQAFHRIFLKGAPERVLALCDRFLTGAVEGATQSADPEFTKQFTNAYENFGRGGQRVLAFAYLDLSYSEFPANFQFSHDPSNFPLSKFIFIGLVSLMDPPKKGVRTAIAKCRTAGIQVVMVTGDHPVTAEAIGRKIGIIQGSTLIEAANRLQKPIQSVTEDEYDAIIVHGDRIDSLSSQDWDLILSKREVIFARTTPKHKLAIVTRYQQKGHVVGVSGDGVNDSPALKKADLGISMNHSASDVSKEAAAMILLDDNFSTIITGILQGRLIFENLKKSFRYTMTHSTPEILAFVLFVLLGMPLPLSPMLLLFIDLGTELGPAISYAWEPPESDLMLIPPRKVLGVDNLGAPAAAPKSKCSAAFTFDPDNSSKNSLVRIWNWYVLRPFSAISKKFHHVETGEVLVDDELLVWCYLLGGIIEAIGCFLTFLFIMYQNDIPMSDLIATSKKYFLPTSPDLESSVATTLTAPQQVDILQQAQSGYYLAIVINQWVNLFLQKHRYAYPWGLSLFVNWRTYVGIVIGMIISALVVYTPGIRKFFGGSPVGPIPLMIPLCSGLLLYMFEVLRKFLLRRGWFGGLPRRNPNLVELLRTTTSIVQNVK